MLDGSQRSYDIHGFGDGSRLTYAVVAYIRVVYEDRVEVKLIYAKTKKKYVPLKGRTLPQNELLVATVASQLVWYLKTVFIEVEDVHYWNDSQCVLKWIQNHERRYFPFVRSRITEIHDTTGGNLWRHCQTGDNPADSPTRGLTVNQLKTATWWNEPYWLSDEEAIEKLSFTPEVCPRPAKRMVDSTTLQVCVDNIESLILGEEDEKPVWAENQKSMCHRVINGKHTLKLDVSKKWIVMVEVVDQTKIPMERKQLSTQVKNKMGLQSWERGWKAGKLIVKRKQHEHYSDEMIKAFKMGSWVGPRLTNVCAPLDLEVLLSANVRLDLYVELHIQVLPTKSAVRKRVGQCAHIHLGHWTSVAVVTTPLCKRFWSLRMYEYVRRIIRHCFECQNLNHQFASQEFGDLPKEGVRICLAGGDQTWESVLFIDQLKAMTLAGFASSRNVACFINLRRARAVESSDQDYLSAFSDVFEGSRQICRNKTATSPEDPGEECCLIQVIGPV
jgi:hypothetical protein